MKSCSMQLLSGRVQEGLKNEEKVIGGKRAYQHREKGEKEKGKKKRAAAKISSITSD